jgi:hypothetical protein
MSVYKTNQVGHKSGGLTRQVRPTMQMGQSIDVPVLTANIFVAATDKTNKTRQGRLSWPLSSVRK